MWLIFKYHEHQDDLWFFPVGNAQVVLYDLREDSPTRGETNVFYMGEDNPILFVILRMVAHGYRVLGNEPAIIIYFTTMSYNREKPDEKRIAWDDPAIGFDCQEQVNMMKKKNSFFKVTLDDQTTRLPTCRPWRG
ncbi:MAG: dTDP-4-dehydrorhamnose 3,5-epimerase family protein [Peptococcaceae bacterium]|nr:dTDP-4-dehydrorhamnose 3,5-epimerase family protein [Peptococcaceae bacterium]